MVSIKSKNVQTQEKSTYKDILFFQKEKEFHPSKKLLGDNTIHLEQRKGSHQQAKDYCTKDESRLHGPYEYGDDKDLVKSKKRKFEDIRDKIKSGASELDIADEYFGLWCRYYKAFSAYRMLVSKPRDFETEVRVYWGKAGVGKSRRATYEAGPNAYRKPRGKWWDGYDGESNVIFDDFTDGSSWMNSSEYVIGTLTEYLSKEEYVNFRPKLIIFHIQRRSSQLV